MATKSSEQKAREQARNAAFNLIPAAQIEAAESFGSAANELAHAQAKVRKLEEDFHEVTKHALENGWTREKLTELLNQLDDLPVTPPLPRIRKSRKTTNTAPNTSEVESATEAAPITLSAVSEPATPESAPRHQSYSV